jgi:hypothetical protein
MFVDIVLKEHWFYGNKLAVTLAEETTTNIRNDHAIAFDGLVKEVDRGHHRDHRYSCPGDMVVLLEILVPRSILSMATDLRRGLWHGDDVGILFGERRAR